VSEIEVSNAESIVQGIDHLIMMVGNLEAAEQLWQRLGFATTARGFHRTGGTANHLIMLEGTYLELLGMANPGSPPVYRDMMENPGLWGVALRGSAQATFRLWSAGGFQVAAPEDLARGVEIDGRSELARFRLTMLERSPQLPFLLFCCEHLTPQFVWHSKLPAHPNGARRLRELVVLVEDGVTRRSFERIAGHAALGGTPEEASLVLGDSRIALVAAGAFEKRFGVAARFGKRRAPLLAGFVLASDNVDRARQFAETAGCAVRDTATGFVAHLPDEGVLIEWSPDA
jgi:catechol 2,3-dioxygenase-like lactoylglutathione lyase family enzyme